MLDRGLAPGLMGSAENIRLALEARALPAAALAQHCIDPYPGGVTAPARLLAAAVIATCAAAAQDVQYNRDIRPVLSRNCFQCHGPDAATRKAKLRLDVAGHGKEREILERIGSADPKRRMPPPKSGKSLSKAQVDRLRNWVDNGAHYERHWAFVPPSLPELPAGDATHPIDRFVRAKLAQQGLTPSPQADKATLVRRVYLDLIGLSPTPEEADAFLADRSPTAYERLVDRLLASPRYGERWARRWLDLARYGDSNGYEKDRNRSIWPYRDWVIRAINEDMPFDRFAIEQIAGDMLEDATTSQIIATGFHRNTMLNEEGGIDPLEYRFHAMTDRVATTGTAFLGLTLGCAQCHTHKFDPVTQSEYYGLMAFLNNADEPDHLIPDPTKLADHRRRLAKARELIDGLAQQWPGGQDQLERRFAAWLEKRRALASRWTHAVPTKTTTNLPKIVVEDDAVLFVRGDTTKHDWYRLRFDPAPHEVAAIRLEALPDDRLPARGPGMTFYEGRKGDFFLSEFSIVANGQRIKLARGTHSYAKNQFGNNPVSAQLTLDGDLQTGWSISGRKGERHVAVFELERPLPKGTSYEIEMHFGRHFASSLGKFRISTTARLRAPAKETLGAEVDALLAKASEQLGSDERKRLRDEFLLRSKELAKQSQRIRALQRRPRLSHSLVMQERGPGHTRATFRHHRGEYLQARERVEPHVPEVLHAWPEGSKRNRLAFARWLVSRDNPLVARVVVNRDWAAFFGKGLVRTIEDFGTQGELPSHPKLLDWLAVSFMNDGWSRKRLHQRIVTSATYKQSSSLRRGDRARDPGERWLARMPRFRLEAEIIRDATLRAAGLLSSKMFGPPVRPPQPRGVTEVAWGNPKWRASKGEDRYRRSVYTFVKRTAPFAFFVGFDAPSGEACVARRDKSNTALQALSLLNDPMMLEAAQALGKQLADKAAASTAASKGASKGPSKGDARVAAVRERDSVLAERCFRRVLTRKPRASEVAKLVDFVRRQREHFGGDLAAARRAIGAPTNKKSKPRGKNDAKPSWPAKARKPVDDAAIGQLVERAVWTSLARALFALDEHVTRG